MIGLVVRIRVRIARLGIGIQALFIRRESCESVHYTFSGLSCNRRRETYRSDRRHVISDARRSVGLGG